MAAFRYKPSSWVPFRDQKVIDRVRRISRQAITVHPNPDLTIQVVPDDMAEFIWLNDLFYRIKTAMDADRSCVLILPNPAHTYVKLALMLNRFRVRCRKLWVFIMDEYANENGVIAPDTWKFGFMYAFKRFFIQTLDPKLRPPARQIVGPTARNVNDYGRIIADLGGADACYSGPGWTGHLAFIEPDAPEFAAGSLEEWMSFGPRVVTLSPFTIAQNALHGFFGMSGDLAAVPPKAFTIGPAQVKAARYRMDMSSITTAGTSVSWQRFITRLVWHGPVTPCVPTSLHQLLKTDVIITETNAAEIRPQWDRGY